MYRWLTSFSVVAVLAFQVLAAQSPAPSIWGGIYTIQQSDRGNLLYTRHCSACHGTFLEGKSIPQDGVRRVAAPALEGWEFMGNWKSLAVADLLDRMRVSMPQQAPGTLSRQQNADILAYVLNKNGFPAGSAELLVDGPILTEIKF